MQDTRQKIRGLIEAMKEQGDVIFGEIIPLLNEMETLRTQSADAASHQESLAAAQTRAVSLEQELQAAQTRLGEHDRQLIALREALAAAQAAARLAEANAERDAAATTQKGVRIPANPEAAAGASNAEIAASYGALQYQIEMLDFAAGQQDMIKAVQDGALHFAARAAMFIVKGAQAVAWSGSGFEIDIRNRTVPLGTPNAFQRAFTALRWQQGDGGETSLQQFTRQAPGAWGLFPILVRGKVAALLYVDDGGLGKPIYAAPLATLTRVAGLAIDSQANRDRRMPQTPEKLALVLGGASAAAAPAAEQLLEMEMIPGEPADAPQVETMVETLTEAAPTAVPPAPPAKIMPPPPPPVEESARPQAPLIERVPPPVHVAPPPPPPPPPPVALAPPPLPLPSSSAVIAAPAAAPAPSAASAGASDIPPEEKRLHDDARRYARVLAQEIMLYNAQKVELGRKKNNIYSLLKDEIDKSREAYERRFKQPQLQNRSYFHDALIQYLCEGNPSSLGV